jgi:hypothetical protein
MNHNNKLVLLDYEAYMRSKLHKPILDDSTVINNKDSEKIIIRKTEDIVSSPAVDKDKVKIKSSSQSLDFKPETTNIRKIPPGVPARKTKERITTKTSWEENWLTLP